MSERPGSGDVDPLIEAIARHTERRERARRERDSILGQARFVGVVGLVFVSPVVLGAYLGHWLDGCLAGYSVRWTIGLLVAGVAIGAVNVYLMIRR